MKKHKFAVLGAFEYMNDYYLEMECQRCCLIVRVPRGWMWYGKSVRWGVSPEAYKPCPGPPW